MNIFFKIGSCRWYFNRGTLDFCVNDNMDKIFGIPKKIKVISKISPIAKV
tara:strand:- start:406 stop:555 length:150 start_codon:yes stop_codon:yes gene_type:complete